MRTFNEKRFFTATATLLALLLALSLPAALLAACDGGHDDEINVKLYLTDEDRTLELPFNELLVGTVCALIDPEVEYPDEAMRAISLSVESMLLFLCGKCEHADAKNVDFCDSADSGGISYLSKDQLCERLGSARAESMWESVSNISASVLGLAVCHEGEIALALCHESSYLLTEDASEIFPYLRSVRSYEEKIESITRIETRVAEARIYGRYGTNAAEISIHSRRPSGRVDKVSIGETSVDGDDFARLMGLPSSDFTIERVGNEYVFRSLGSGNGLGLSRQGAVAMASEGYDAEAIIENYYPGTTIERVDLSKVLSNSRS